MGNTCKPARNRSGSVVAAETGLGGVVNDNEYPAAACPMTPDTTVSKSSTAGSLSPTLTTYSKCQLCCQNDNQAEDSDKDDTKDNPTRLHTATYCGTCRNHANYCQDCWKKWILACEERGLVTPTCPNCRAVLPDTHVQNLLGRPYQPPVPGTIRRSSLDPMDLVPTDEELQTAMLDLGYRQCTNCAAWIERLQGCTAMQCLCGQRFCFDCGLAIILNNNDNNNNNNNSSDDDSSNIVVTLDNNCQCNDWNAECIPLQNVFNNE